MQTVTNKITGDSVQISIDYRLNYCHAPEK